MPRGQCLLRKVSELLKAIKLIFALNAKRGNQRKINAVADAIVFVVVSV